MRQALPATEPAPDQALAIGSVHMQGGSPHPNARAWGAEPAHMQGLHQEPHGAHCPPQVSTQSCR